LLRAGLDEAATVGLPTWLESSVAGYPLYRKFGFKEVDDIVIDLSKHGGEGSARVACMLRSAES
jgi:hypothetical protein